MTKQIYGNSVFSRILPNIQQVAVYIIALAVAFGLKYHYSHSNEDGLIWVLAPTAVLVETMLPVHFELEKGQGYICHEQGIIIAPACAGINFMIICFCMMAFCGLNRLRHQRDKYAWLLFSLICAIVLAVTANSFRIVASIYSYGSGLHWEWFTPSWIHLISGICIYVTVLYGVFFMVQWILGVYAPKKEKQKRLVRRSSLKSTLMKWIIPRSFPQIWYLCVTLGIPILNGGYEKNKIQFLEYGITVIGASLTICLCIFSSLYVYHFIRKQFKRLSLPIK